MSTTAPTRTTEPAQMRAIRDWLESRRRSAWSPGWSEDFRRGYDTAVYEVAAMLGEKYEVDRVAGDSDRG